MKTVSWTENTLVFLTPKWEQSIMVKDVLFMMSSSKTVSKQTPPPPQGGRRSKASLQSWKALRRGKKWVPETLPTQWIGKEHTPSLKLFKFLFWKKNLYLFTKIERKKKSLSEAQNIFSKVSFPPRISFGLPNIFLKKIRKWKQKIVFISFHFLWNWKLKTLLELDSP